MARPQLRARLGRRAGLIRHECAACHVRVVRRRGSWPDYSQVSRAWLVFEDFVRFYRQSGWEGTWLEEPPATALLAQSLTGDPFLARPRCHSQPIVASLDGQGPPSETLIDAVTTGHGIDLYRPIDELPINAQVGLGESVTASWPVVVPWCEGAWAERPQLLWGRHPCASRPGCLKQLSCGRATGFASVTSM